MEKPQACMHSARLPAPLQACVPRQATALDARQKLTYCTLKIRTPVLIVLLSVTKKLGLSPLPLPVGEHGSPLCAYCRLILFQGSQKGKYHCCVPKMCLFTLLKEILNHSLRQPALSRWHQIQEELLRFGAHGITSIAFLSLLWPLEGESLRAVF